jgi:RhoGAP domain
MRRAGLPNTRRIDTFGEEDVDVEQWMATMNKLLASLPPENVFVLQTLLETCRRVVTKAEVNLMSPNNLAIVLAPNLLRNNHDDPLKVRITYTPTHPGRGEGRGERIVERRGRREEK